jgi:hypothetical protein
VLVFFGDHGLVAWLVSVQANPRLGPSGASTFPRIWIRSINLCAEAVKRKSQNLAKFFSTRLYLVVPFQECRAFTFPKSFASNLI